MFLKILIIFCFGFVSMMANTATPNQQNNCLPPCCKRYAQPGSYPNNEITYYFCHYKIISGAYFCQWECEFIDPETQQPTHSKWICNYGMIGPCTECIVDTPSGEGSSVCNSAGYSSAFETLALWVISNQPCDQIELVDCAGHDLNEILWCNRSALVLTR